MGSNSRPPDHHPDEHDLNLYYLLSPVYPIHRVIIGSVIMFLLKKVADQSCLLPEKIFKGLIIHRIEYQPF